MTNTDRTFAAIYFILSFVFIGLAVLIEPLNFITAAVFWTLGIMSYIDSKFENKD